MKTIIIAMAFIITNIYTFLINNVQQEMGALFCEVDYVYKIVHDLQVTPTHTAPGTENYIN
jgi:hypothetical protein